MKLPALLTCLCVMLAVRTEQRKQQPPAIKASFIHELSADRQLKDAGDQCGSQGPCWRTKIRTSSFLSESCDVTHCDTIRAAMLLLEANLQDFQGD